jgi:hypothetical protein
VAIASRVFGTERGANSARAPLASPPAPASSAPRAASSLSPAKPAAPVCSFVSENDVRLAMTRSEKILIGPKTIVTPSARDLGTAHEVFVETDGV